MPVWAWILIAVLTTVAIAAVAVAVFAVLRRAQARYLRRLAGSREEAKALKRAFDELVGGLQQGTHERRAMFADDPEAIERHSLADLSGRARALAEELNTAPMPQRFVGAAEALADASDILAEEAERAGEGSIGDESLEALVSADLNRVDRAFSYADEHVGPLIAEYDIDEQDVDVKGLYV